MAKSIANYAGGINQLAQAAVRADGAVFRRVLVKGPYGNAWTRWSRAGQVDVSSLPASMPCGLGNMYRATNYDCMSRVRLPND